MTEDPEDIDALFSRLDLTDADLDRVIAYQRKQRAQREAGVKVRKPKGEAKPPMALADLLSMIPKPAPPPRGTIKRRF